MPNISNPALQNAETEWKILFQIPSFTPYNGPNCENKITAPNSSKHKVTINIFKKSLKEPDNVKLLVDSFSISRSFKLMRLPVISKNSVKSDITPSPPICIISKITPSPKPVHVEFVSFTTSPVTQEAEVAVNNASRKEMSSVFLCDIIYINDFNICLGDCYGSKRNI